MKLVRYRRLLNSIVVTTALSVHLCACTSTESSEPPAPSTGQGTLAQTAYEHAQVCAAQLGPIPVFDLTTATKIPIKQAGVPIENAEALQCDHPAAFQAPCEPGLLGRLQGTRPSGAEDPDVVWTYIYRSGGFAAIGYHSGSGATCFLEIDNLPTPTVLESPMVLGRDAYNAQWTSPREMFEVSRCQDCHMADPFLHSPYIDQVRDPANPDTPLIPIISGASNPRPPYQIISSPVAPTVPSCLKTAVQHAIGHNVPPCLTVKTAMPSMSSLCLLHFMILALGMTPFRWQIER